MSSSKKKYDIHIRFKEYQQPLYDQLKQLAEKRGISISDLVLELVSRALTGITVPLQDVEEIKGGKIITLQYPAYCSKCGRRLEPGDLAYWVKYKLSNGETKTVILCLDCYYSVSDQTLAKKRQKLYLLERDKKALENEIKRLVKLYSEIELAYNIKDLHYRVEALVNALERVLDNKQLVDSIRKDLDDIMRRLKKLEEFTNRYIIPDIVEVKP